MTRLSYDKVNDNVMVSRKELLAGDKLIKVNLLLDTLTFTITDIEGNVLFGSESQKSLQMLKKLAKEHVKGMGVTFNDEVRPVRSEAPQT